MECLFVRAGRQISSVSFHPSGKALAIAAGHKVCNPEMTVVESA